MGRWGAGAEVRRGGPVFEIGTAGNDRPAPPPDPLTVRKFWLESEFESEVGTGASALVGRAGLVWLGLGSDGGSGRLFCFYIF